jgi:uncharacterized protein (TIGR03067 family)
LAALGVRGVSLADDAVKKDVGAAVSILSTTPETQSDRVAEALAMVKRHEQKQALAELIGWLGAEQATQRRSAVYIIQLLAWHDPAPAWPHLRKLLSHSEGFTRGMAAMTLAATKDVQSYAEVTALMNSDQDPYVRRCAAWAVGEFGDPKAIEDLQKALADENALVKANAQNGIERVTFLREHADAKGDAIKVVRGIFVISGSGIFQKERIDRAVAMIRSAQEPTRSEMLDQLKHSSSQAIRNSASLAGKRLLVGTWKVVSTSSDGQTKPPEQIGDMRVIISGEQYTVAKGGQVVGRANMTADPTKQPKTIDLVVTEGEKKGQVFPGIYELSGDTLRIAWSQPRPTEISDRAGSQQEAWELRRE